jgi:[ribosomal protein S5]-alanine N-acetyltransferase
MLEEIAVPVPVTPIDAAPAIVEDRWALVPFPPAPIFTTSRLIIRPFHINDAPHLARIANNIKIARNEGNRFPNPVSLDDARAFINSTRPTDPTAKPHYSFEIVLKDGPDAGTVVGGCGLEPGDDVFSRTCEIGYWLGEEFWGKGYATEMAAQLVAYAFGLGEADGFGGDKRLEKISAQVFSGNPASMRVLTKSGFANEATLRRTVWRLGEWRDLTKFGLLREEWEEKRVDGAA